MRARVTKVMAAFFVSQQSKSTGSSLGLLGPMLPDFKQPMPHDEEILLDIHFSAI